jgi:hypothetical protein
VVSFYGSQWELYNLRADRFEQQDLARDYPGKVQQLSGLWFDMAEHTDLLEEKDRLPVGDFPASNTHREWHRQELVEDWKAPL